MWNTLLLTMGFIAVAFVLLAIKVLFVKNGVFPSSHIGASQEMRKKGISCAVTTDANERKRKSLQDLMKKEKII